MLNNFVKLVAIVMIAGCQKTTSTTSTTVETSSTPTIANQIKFTGNGFVHNGAYPKIFTCDSLGVSPGLQWTNAPSTSISYAITMYHIPPGGGNHQYMVLYNIPATTLSIPDNSKSIGSFGMNTVDGKATYSPPCSQGPGAKIYVLTLYALNAQPTITVPNTQVTMEILRTGMKNKIVDSAVMSVTYTRQ
jgi:phosphatidylethanolamine-binding protein (PEBP) family uncharacterized protein